MRSLWPHGDGMEYSLTEAPEPVYTNDEKQRLTALYEKGDECAEAGDDDGYSDAGREWEAIEKAAQIRAWTPEFRATSGVVVGFDGYGDLCVQRGVIRLSDIETVEPEESRDTEQPQVPQESTVEPSGASRFEYQSTDLLANLMHLCSAKDLPFCELLIRAGEHFRDEAAG